MTCTRQISSPRMTDLRRRVEPADHEVGEVEVAAECGRARPGRRARGRGRPGACPRMRGRHRVRPRAGKARGRRPRRGRTLRRRGSRPRRRTGGGRRRRRARRPSRSPARTSSAAAAAVARSDEAMPPKLCSSRTKLGISSPVAIFASRRAAGLPLSRRCRPRSITSMPSQPMRRARSNASRSSRPPITESRTPTFMPSEADQIDGVAGARRLVDHPRSASSCRGCPCRSKAARPRWRSTRRNGGSR